MLEKLSAMLLLSSSVEWDDGAVADVSFDMAGGCIGASGRHGGEVAESGVRAVVYVLRWLAPFV